MTDDMRDAISELREDVAGNFKYIDTIKDSIPMNSQFALKTILDAISKVIDSAENHADDDDCLLSLFIADAAQAAIVQCILAPEFISDISKAIMSLKFATTLQ